MAQTFARIEVSLKRRKWKAIKSALGVAAVVAVSAMAAYYFLFMR